MNTLEVILVDENDIELGRMGKLEAHQKGKLHRAFSIILFNKHGELLLQQRASNKYHSPNLWTNTCCSHQVPGEDESKTILRRLDEEMGISCKLNKSFSFLYKAKVGDDLIEHELDHVYVGEYNDNCYPNSQEVQDWKYMSIDQIELELTEEPAKFTEWFKILIPKIKAQLVGQNFIL